MLNQVILNGIVKEDVVVKETNTGIHYASMVLKVEREYRNSEGAFDVDEISIMLWRSVADQCASYCRAGTNATIKGRIQSSLYNREDGSVFYNYEIIAEKVFFLEK